ncbi:MAG: Tad domain-containing protein, partial [Bryobacterales bacterium]|nr:Tad domain-containing protein [Bryobacterales bacterium]
MANTQIVSRSAHRNGTHSHRPHEKGFALLLATMSLLFLVPLAGLAIDAGMAYIVKTRLSVAVDSACLSAARSLNRGLTLAEQRDAARGVALRYFNANFPQDHFGTTGVAPLVDINESQTRMRTVTVNATRRAPLYFMPILGEHFADVNVVGQATRRDSNVILVLDRSGSMQINGSVPAMKNAATKFAQSFANG